MDARSLTCTDEAHRHPQPLGAALLPPSPSRLSAFLIGCPSARARPVSIATDSPAHLSSVPLTRTPRSWLGLAVSSCSRRSFPPLTSTARTDTAGPTGGGHFQSNLEIGVRQESRPGLDVTRRQTRGLVQHQEARSASGRRRGQQQGETRRVQQQQQSGASLWRAGVTAAAPASRDCHAAAVGAGGEDRPAGASLVHRMGGVGYASHQSNSFRCLTSNPNINPGHRRQRPAPLPPRARRARAGR